MKKNICSRRNFLKKGISAALATALPLSAFKLLSPHEAKAAIENSNLRWVFLVDTNKCVGCGLCVKACKQENEIPYDTPVTRTWVERYVVTKDGKSHIDSPDGAREGFTATEIQEEKIDPKDISKAFFVPKFSIRKVEGFFNH